MTVKMIGYLEVNPWKGEIFYNFWPRLVQLKSEDTWQEWPSREDTDYQFLRTKGRELAVGNGDVVYLAAALPDYSGLEDAVEKFHQLEGLVPTGIRPALMEGFVPVFSAPALDEAFRIREHTTLTADKSVLEPYISLDGSNKARQKGPAFVNPDGSAALRAGDRFRVLSKIAVDGENLQPGEGAEELHLREGARCWKIFEDVTQGGTSYVFPEFVFLSDLESGQPEEKPEETAVQSEENAPKSLPDLLCERVWEYRPAYSREDILSIAINLTQNFITVFSGKPGCGKTSICNIFAQVLGLREQGQYVPVQVERGWTSKRDLIGYYNPVSDTVVKANARLYQALEAGGEDYPLLILLDEANLSPMEYYWSDFIGIAGGGDAEAEREIHLGGEESGLTIPTACRFVATINSDHTTEPLSPRMIDRAAVVTLPEGGGLMDKDFVSSRKLSKEDHHSAVTWEELQESFGTAGLEEAKLVQEFQSVAGIYMDLKKKLTDSLNVDVSYRAETAILRFWYAARREGVFAKTPGGAGDITALDYAVAQRLLPKLEGSGESYKEALEDLKTYCAKAGLTKCAGILSRILRDGDQGSAALNYYSFF